MTPDTPTTPLDVRASDDDREAVIALLRDHTAAGRLTVDELSERIDEAYASRSLRQLRGVLRELPVSAPPPSRPARTHASEAPARHRSDHRAAILAFVAVNALLIAIWALTGMGYFWPIWPLLGWGVGLIGQLRDGHAHGLGHGYAFGPCGRRRVERRPTT